MGWDFFVLKMRIPVACNEKDPCAKIQVSAYRKSILAEEFLDFLIGLGEFVFTEFHQGFSTF